jgi:hypothetical protein
MTKRQIEVNDVLPDCVQSAIEQVEEELRDYIKENTPDKCPCLSNDLDYSGAIHEIIDGAVPIYGGEIEAAWFLHGRDLEAAYENAGVGSNPRENDGMAAIYFYISEKVAEWYAKNAEEIWHDSCTDEK